MSVNIIQSSGCFSGVVVGGRRGAQCWSVCSESSVWLCFISPWGGITRWPSDSVQRHRQQRPASESGSWDQCSPRILLRPPVTAEGTQSHTGATDLPSNCEHNKKKSHIWSKYATKKTLQIPTCVLDLSIFGESAVTRCATSPQICYFKAKAHTVISAMLTSKKIFLYNWKTFIDNEVPQRAQLSVSPDTKHL